MKTLDKLDNWLVFAIVITLIVTFTQKGGAMAATKLGWTGLAQFLGK